MGREASILSADGVGFCPHETGQSVLLHLLNEMLMSSTNTLTDIRRIRFKQMSGHPVKLTHKVNQSITTLVQLGTGTHLFKPHLSPYKDKNKFRILPNLIQLSCIQPPRKEIKFVSHVYISPSYHIAQVL